MQSKEDKNRQLEESLKDLNQKLNDANGKLNELNQQVANKDETIRKSEASFKSVESVKAVRKPFLKLNWALYLINFNFKELETNKQSLSKTLAELQAKYESLLNR